MTGFFVEISPVSGEILGFSILADSYEQQQLVQEILGRLKILDKKRPANFGKAAGIERLKRTCKIARTTTKSNPS